MCASQDPTRLARGHAACNGAISHIAALQMPAHREAGGELQSYLSSTSCCFSVRILALCCCAALWHIYSQVG